MKIPEFHIGAYRYFKQGNSKLAPHFMRRQHIFLQEFDTNLTIGRILSQLSD